MFRGALGVIDGIYTCITGVRRCIKVRYGIYTCIAKVLGVFRGALGVIDGIYTCIAGVHGVFRGALGTYSNKVILSTHTHTIYYMYISSCIPGVHRRALSQGQAPALRTEPLDHPW